MLHTPNSKHAFAEHLLTGFIKTEVPKEWLFLALKKREKKAINELDTEIPI